MGCILYLGDLAEVLKTSCHSAWAPLGQYTKHQIRVAQQSNSSPDRLLLNLSCSATSSESVNDCIRFSKMDDLFQKLAALGTRAVSHVAKSLSSATVFGSGLMLGLCLTSDDRSLALL